MSRRLLGNFSPENLIRGLNLIPRSEKSSFLRRVGSRRPGPTKGPPPQHNFTFMRAMASKLMHSDSTTMEDPKETTEGKVNGG
ncbi:hypothetical protein QN277_009291 [Acacia crassicarpa]|uniref:Uncharacterized protein n=1 Tax=Acacia crassicarpa TaxID=499986 RepID=A0AAE1IUS7_9FABA|nr:hypothetical protein QN277_009291 [Acacia crassicarpa]